MLLSLHSKIGKSASTEPMKTEPIQITTDNSGASPLRV